MSPIFDGPLTAGAGTEIVLDPEEEATGRVELHLNVGPIRVAPGGPDWGDAQIEQYLAEATLGQLPVDFRVPNRTITLPLLLGAAGPASFPAARAQLQAKVALFQRKGGIIRRGPGLYADITNATLKMPDRFSHLGVEADVVLTLETLPDFYEAEQTLTPVSTTGARRVYEDVPGDYPSRVRIALTEDSSNDQSGVLWGMRSHHYSADATAALELDAEDLTPLDIAAAGTVDGVTAVSHANLGSDWTAILSTEIDGVGHLTHTGTYRLWARLYTSDFVTSPTVRFVWDVGDLAFASENTPVSVPADASWYWLDLGEVRLDPAPIGTHEWRGVIQAKADLSGTDVAIDKLKLIPVDEGYGVLRAPVGATPGITAFLVRDDFLQTAGSLAGKTATLGGTWAGAGDATDFTVNATADTVERAETGDAADVGRWATVGPSLAAVAVETNVSWVHVSGAFAIGERKGVTARFIDADNNITATIYTMPTGSPGTRAEVVKRVLGVPTVLLANLSVPYQPSGAWRGVRLEVDPSGVWRMAVGSEYVASGQDDDLKTAGDLETGTTGIYDEYRSTGVQTRSYANLVTWEPVRNAVVHADQDTELRHDGMFREDSSGGTFSPIAHVLGDLPRLPISGMEGSPVELIVVGSRGDFDALPDTGPADTFTVAVHARPCWLFPPIA